MVANSHVGKSFLGNLLRLLSKVGLLNNVGIERASIHLSRATNQASHPDRESIFARIVSLFDSRYR